ncbi:competence protein ComEC [Thermocrinis minervae]|uniref:Competence protein ComEC n=1 Tax=Thermocrinis minervae TaxID=381751 RepID=A0A1M6TJL1_9AQUI|nr:competence protein ComEC [Thermocrinis minervae]
MSRNHLRALLFLIFSLIFSLFVNLKDKLPDLSDEGVFYLRVDGIPQAEDSGLKVKVLVEGGDLMDLQGKMAYLTLRGVHNLGKDHLEVDARVKIKDGRIYLSANSEDILDAWDEDGIRKRLISKLEEKVKDPLVRDFTKAYIFGEDADLLPLEVQRSFWESGLLHILVVSGSHIALIFMVFYRFLPYPYGHILSLILSFFYTFYVVRTEPPVLRAFLMFLLYVMAKLSDHRPDYVSILFVSGAIILFVFPEYLQSYSFWLSFFATLFILLSIKEAPIQNKVFMSFWVSIFAFLGTAPLVASFSLTTPMSILLTAPASLILTPYTVYSFLDLFTLFSLPSFPLEILGKLAIESIRVMSNLGFLLNLKASALGSFFCTTASALVLYFTSGWWKLLAFVPLLLIVII